MDFLSKIKSFGQFTGILFIGLGIGLLISIFFWGVVFVSKILYPFFLFLSVISPLIFVCIIIPLSFFKPLRPLLINSIFVLTLILEISIFMYALLMGVYYVGGWFFIFLFFFRFMIIPAGIIIFLFKDWHSIANIIIVYLCISGMRFYGNWLFRVTFFGQDDIEISEVSGEIESSRDSQ